MEGPVGSSTPIRVSNWIYSKEGMGNRVVPRMSVIWSNGTQSAMKACLEDEETIVQVIREDPNTNPGWK